MASPASFPSTPDSMMQSTRRLLWRLGAALALAVGLIGVVVPGLPTVPLLIVSAWAAGKGWPALERWLLAHQVYGPQIHAWRERGSVARKAKVAATLMMLVSAIVIQFMAVSLWLQVGLPLTLAAVLCWLWTRPET